MILLCSLFCLTKDGFFSCARSRRTKPEQVSIVCIKSSFGRVRLRLSGFAHVTRVQQSRELLIASSPFRDDFRPNYYYGGRFDGAKFRPGNSAKSHPAVFLYDAYNSIGTDFGDFDPDGSGSLKGDPRMDDMTRKLRLEFDEKKAMELGHEIQRYEAQKQYHMAFPGGATVLSLGWPAVRNLEVWRGGTGGRSPNMYYWLDPTKAPAGRS